MEEKRLECVGMTATIENLKTAIIGESSACAKCAAYANEATQAGSILVSKLIGAASTTDHLLITNHAGVLAKRMLH